MKINNFVINDTQRIDVSSIGGSITIGTDNESDVKVLGPGNTSFMEIIVHETKIHIKLIKKNAIIKINNKLIDSEREIYSGDQIEFYGVIIDISVENEELFISIDEKGSNYLTKAPEFENEQEYPSNEKIHAKNYTVKKDDIKTDKKIDLANWKITVSVIILFLVSSSYYIFDSESVKFEIQPRDVDHLSIQGGWFQIPLGDRYLLRPGDYSVEIEKEGFYPLIQNFIVTEEANQIIPVSLKKLPGILNIYTNTNDETQIFIDDDYIAVNQIKELKLDPGFHKLEIISERFLSYSGGIFVRGMNISQDIYVGMIPGWSEIRLESRPSGADIYKDDVKIGQTPTSFNLMEGMHTITLSKEGFNAWDRTFSVVASSKESIGPIILEPANAELDIKTIPSGANVNLDGMYRGQTPLKVSLNPNQEYIFSFSKNGFKTVDRQFRLNSAEKRTVTIDLAAIFGQISILLNEEDADVYIDKKKVGNGSLTLDLPTTEHTLTVTKPGYKTFTRKINPRVNYPQKIEVNILSEEEYRNQSVVKFILNSQEQELRRIGPGEFTMGSSRREVGRRANEVIRNVEVTQSYFIGTKEVTNRDFSKFRSISSQSADVHPSLIADNNPVVLISWSDAIEYCNWLSDSEGLDPAYVKRFEKWELKEPHTNGYRLPSEAEWVWAIKYESKNNSYVFPWGNRIPPRNDFGNYADSAAQKLLPNIIPNYNDGYSSSSPVGSFQANSLGIYDGSGNVSEWISDYYSIPTPGVPDIIKDPKGPKSGTQHVIRGSSWRHANVTQLRHSYRDFGNEGRIDVGFRIARNTDD